MRFQKGNKYAFKKDYTPWNKNKKLSKNHRDKIGKGNKGKIVSIEVRKKISKSHIGLTHTEGSKEKMRKHHADFSGKNHPNWKDGKTKNSYKYILIHKPKHPFAKKGYVLRSRLVMEKHLGHYLKREEIVHHKGTKYPIYSIKNKQDDRIENLQLFSNNSTHMKYHRLLVSSLFKVLTLPHLEHLISN